MRTKKLSTVKEGEVIMVLKETNSVSTEPQLKGSAQTSFRNWGSLNSETGVSADSVNSAHRNCTLDNKRSGSHLQDEKVICGKSSFLSRFIEFRINDNKLCSKMAPAAENDNEESESLGTGNVSVVDGLVSDSHAAIESFVDRIDSVQSQISPHQLDNDSLLITEEVSVSDTSKEDNGSTAQSENSLLKQFELNTNKNTVISVPVTNKAPEIRRVEELTTRIEGKVENTNYLKERKNVHTKLKNCKNESSIKRIAAEVQQDGVKLEIKRTGSNTKDNPPRKVSFKVRSCSNNGRLSSLYMSSAGFRRSTTLNKGVVADPRAPNVSSKVAALASKFNAIILENKEERSVEIVQNDSRKSLMIPPLPEGSITSASKKQPPTEKMSSPRRNSCNTKRESISSNHGNNTKSSSLGIASRKHSSARQHLLETDNNQKISNSNTKDCRRRNNNSSYRPSAVGSKSGSVKAAIQIFEKNAAVSPSTKNSAVGSSGNQKNIGNCSVGTSGQSSTSAEAKKEPKYPRVIYKRDATLVRVSLDCEDVCNRGRTPEEVENSIKSQVIHCQTSVSELPHGICEEGKEDVCVKHGENVASQNDNQCKSDKNVTVITVKGSSGDNETNCKPAVPVKNVAGEQIRKSVPLSTNRNKDSSYAKVVSYSENIYKTIKNAVSVENTFVRYDKLAFSQRVPAVSESSTNEIPMAKETENSQQRDRELMAPNRSFLWGASPPGTSARAQDEQSTSVPVPESKDCASTDPEDSVPQTNYSTDDIYDDVYPPSVSNQTSIHPYSVVDQQDEGVYDDVGPPVSEEEHQKISKVTVPVR
jgi:hypothetical protein